MIADSIERLSALKVWAPPVPQFLGRPATVRWLLDSQHETRKSDDETVLVFLAALRSLELTILDGAKNAEDLAHFLEQHSDAVRQLCLSKRVQANVTERALPILELLGHKFGRQRLFVTELGSSFGLIGRALVSAPQTLQNFGRYFAASQQRPSAVPLVTGYQGLDLDPPDERWLLACIPLAELRTRVARFIYEVPATPQCTVRRGSAFDSKDWPRAPEGTIPVMLTSFMLYQLPPAERQTLQTALRDHVAQVRGTWINLDVVDEQGQPRFVVQEDGHDRLVLENDLCVRWQRHEG